MRHLLWTRARCQSSCTVANAIDFRGSVVESEQLERYIEGARLGRGSAQ